MSCEDANEVAKTLNQELDRENANFWTPKLVLELQEAENQPSQKHLCRFLMGVPPAVKSAYLGVKQKGSMRFCGLNYCYEDASVCRNLLIDFEVSLETFSTVTLEPRWDQMLEEDGSGDSESNGYQYFITVIGRSYEMILKKLLFRWLSVFGTEVLVGEEKAPVVISEDDTFCVERRDQCSHLHAYIRTSFPYPYLVINRIFSLFFCGAMIVEMMEQRKVDLAGLQEVGYKGNGTRTLRGEKEDFKVF